MVVMPGVRIPRWRFSHDERMDVQADRLTLWNCLTVWLIDSDWDSEMWFPSLCTKRKMTLWCVMWRHLMCYVMTPEHVTWWHLMCHVYVWPWHLPSRKSETCENGFCSAVAITCTKKSYLHLMHHYSHTWTSTDRHTRYNVTRVNDTLSKMSVLIWIITVPSSISSFWEQENVANAA